ncbi:MAG TPA: immunoglobulin domain-containing protein [Verrucomicrobiae bacterium]|nr:immunoglobulin domain-containing protein [Verrucomicrobiae bacterium]
MKRLYEVVGILIISLGLPLSSRATDLVNDTWQDGTRTDPTAANGYAENNGVVGTDADNDGNLESAWFSSSSSALTVPAPGDLRAVQPANSLTVMTYFTPEGSEVNLGAGDTLKITWVFTPTTVNSGNTSLEFPLAVVDSPLGSRVSSDTSPSAAAYAGYAMFMNMGQTLGNNNPFSLEERVASGDLLSSSGKWGANGTASAILTNGATSGNHGFDSGTQYTFTMTFTHNGSNLDITATMIGGTYNNSGTGTVFYTDSTPNSFKFDTFAIRPAHSSTTAAQWDTSLFEVEYIPGSTPATIQSDPVDQTVLVDQDVTFNVQASGTLPLFYQWYFNTNSPIADATNSSLMISSASFTDAGAYSVLVSNNYGSATSAVAQLTVTTFPPSVDSDPVDKAVYVGQDATFSVQASGALPLYYQWYHNINSPIADATNASVTVTNAQLSDAGDYSVLLSNVYGSVTSAVAQLTVSTPVAPSIATQPQDQLNVSPGGTAMFSVTASGSEPLSYQWYYNNSTLLTGATDPTLTITNVQLSNAGSYSVTVNNIAGSVASSNALLTVDTSPVAPSFVSQPASQVVLIGGTANFAASAAGTPPIYYQWDKNGTPILGATGSSLTLTNVQNSDAATYNVTASNAVGMATSSNAVLTVTTAAPIVNSAYDLVGFGGATTGGGVIATNDPAYKQVFTPLDFVLAISNANKTAGSVKVIEVMTNLDLGFNEVGSTVQHIGPLRAPSNGPLLHPVLLTTGVSVIDIQAKSGLTIFSANGSALRHVNLNIKNTSNIILRNLKFDQLWEWDENSKGDYDRNDWDFITIGNGGGTVSNVWIDHCTFTKSYDGEVDMKGGCNHITFSWNKYTGDDGATNPNSWVWQQINYLEQSKSSYPMYNFLRSNGYSTTDIVTIIQGHDKTHLMGANDLDSENNDLSATFHHQWWINPWDRLPRLRAGNVHVYNIYVDDTVALAARRLRDAIKATMPIANQGTLENKYSFKPFLNGTISTENGAILVEKSQYIDCLWPLRNNQTDTNNPAYTGKIKALDTIYQFDSTYVRGDSTDSGNPLGPFQAPIIPFSWNLPGNQLPYTYTMDDPAQLQAIVTSPTGGAGAGVLTWNKTNWMMTSYAPTAPIITADPQSQTVPLSNAVTFTVVAYGSAPMTYQWYFNGSTPLSGATNSSFSLASAQAGDIGTYSVIVSNSAGTATSASATLILQSSASPFQNWQTQYFGCTNCLRADPSADPDGDGMNNEAEFLAGSDPTNSASALHIISVLPQNNDIVVTWQTTGGHTNMVQATVGDGNGGYSTNYVDISDVIILPGSIDLITNYVDVGGATNIPSRFYRVRLVP